MNTDNNIDSKSLSTCKVISKYFSGTPVMDESLSDFQEKKKANTGPKNSEKQTGSKVKPKKVLKRIKGQKDIRTVLKSKKNELVSFTNDFNKICKQSGIDVDSEQLQLAIALSKSLQSENIANSNDPQSSGSLSSQERTGKIRTTLLEYGFKVPEIKINTAKRKLKKHRKHYKLLLTTEIEKHQIISDKYSQVLLENFDSSNVTYCANQCDTSLIQLYHIATNIPYEFIKSDDIFYIENLIADKTRTGGCLLRNWSDIPGRPASPAPSHSDVNFRAINCLQDELDVVLSGSLKSAQDIVKIKYNLYLGTQINDNTNYSTDINLKMDTNLNEIVQYVNVHLMSKPEIRIEPTIGGGFQENNSTDITDVEIPQKLTIPHSVRSCSPDIFDDEVSSILHNSKSNSDTMLQDLTPKDSIKETYDFMDLTECVNVKSQRSLVVQNILINDNPIPQLSQENNTTKRRSNDYMEITNCVRGSSQVLIVNNIKENVDLTQNSDCESNEKSTEESPSKQSDINIKEVESKDLTQSSDSNNSLPFVHVSGKSKSLDDTIILNDYVNNGCNLIVIPENKTVKIQDEVAVNSGDLTELVLDISTEDSKNTKPDEHDLINLISILESEDEAESLSNVAVSKYQSEEEVIQSTLKEKISCANSRNSKTESFFEEYQQSNATSEKQMDDEIFCLDDSLDKSSDENRYDNDKIDIDLTQSLELSDDTTNNVNEKYDTDSLGKKCNTSIDFDEIYDNIVESYHSNSKLSTVSSKSVVHNVVDDIDSSKTSNSLTHCSQNSEVFDISDEELDYSLHKSKHENTMEHFDIGGISVMDNLSNAQAIESNNGSDIVDSMTDSFLPHVELKGTKKYAPNNDVTPEINMYSAKESPFRESSNKYKVSVQTPSNSDYILKTDQVTPLIDYSSLTTPERNKELDKYGLKPLKRKRAIQLLTHLYNQTHPIVESCSREDIPSPSKKQKTDNNYLQSSVSPKKHLKSLETNPKVAKAANILEEQSKSPEALVSSEIRITTNNIHTVTNEVPDVRDIQCSEDEWVFQKREKAKVHSCRVPLHIAFHNHVSSRQGLREAILRYEPVDIDVIHRDLVASGHRYNPKDLLKFMDKKCITVKTSDNKSRSNKRHY